MGPRGRGASSTLLAVLAMAALLLLSSEAFAGVTRNVNQCTPEPDFLKACWSCLFVSKFVSLGYTLSKGGFEALAGAVQHILIYIFPIWIAGEAAKFYMGAGFDVLKGIALRSLVFVIILTSTATGAWQNVYLGDLVSPLFGMGSTMFDEMLSDFNGDGSSVYEAFDIDDSAATSASSGAEATVPGEAAALKAVNVMQQINGWGFWAGLNMMGGYGQGIFGLVKFLIALPPCLALMLVFGISFVSFPFYVLDLFFRVFMLSMVAPLIIGAFLLKPTRSIAVGAIKGLAQSALTLGAIGMVMAFASTLMVKALQMFTSEVSGVASSKFSSLVCALHSDSSTVGFGFEYPGYWFLLCAGLLSVTAMSRARGFIGALIGGFSDGQGMGEKATNLMSSIGTSIGGGMAAGVATGGWLGVGAIGGSAAGLFNHGSMRSMSEGAKQGFSSAMSHTLGTGFASSASKANEALQGGGTPGGADGHGMQARDPGPAGGEGDRK